MNSALSVYHFSLSSHCIGTGLCDVTNDITKGLPFVKRLNISHLMVTTLLLNNMLCRSISILREV